MSGEDLKPGPPGPISVEQLLALNQEIMALVRAGVPLERGLLVAARDLSGSLGRITGALGSRLIRGESLAEALQAEGRSVPPLYRAVVEAGARSGQLPVALEGLARYVRGYADARTAIGLALWYPVLVMALGYALFVGFVLIVVPRFIDAFESLGVTASAPLMWLGRLGTAVFYWWWTGPALLACFAVLWIWSGAAARFHSPAWNALRLFPWMKSILANYETANFSELLALLLAHQVSYPAALLLAAESTGNARLTRGARRLGDAISRGEPAAPALATIDRKTFPPMLRWVLATGQSQGSLVVALGNLAELYRKRARFQAEQLALLLPTILMIALGASVTLFYGLMLFLPMVRLLRGLSGS